MITIDQAHSVLNDLLSENKITFDSHEFINKYRKTYENEYLAMLLDNRSPRNTAVQTTNSIIARFLSQNAKELHIEKDSVVYSYNDHGEKSSNAKWRFI